jgi:hypothetical protein
MGFLKRHIRLNVVVVTTLVVPALAFSLLLGGDLKAVGIGFVVVLAVLLAAILLIGALMLIGWVLHQGRRTVSTAADKLTAPPTASKPPWQPKETHVTVSSKDVKWRKYDGSV